MDGVGAEGGGATDIPAIEEITVEDIGAGVGLLGEILRCCLTYRDDGGEAPASVIVKLPSQEPRTLPTTRRLKLYRREYDYYCHVGPHVPVRSPAPCSMGTSKREAIALSCS